MGAEEFVTRRNAVRSADRTEEVGDVVLIAPGRWQAETIPVDSRVMYWPPHGNGTAEVDCINWLRADHLKRPQGAFKDSSQADFCA